MAQAFGIVSFAGNNIRVGEMQNYRPVGAVSFLGRYRVIDFPISNMSNSEIEHIQVYVRRKPRSLTEHLGTVLLQETPSVPDVQTHKLPYRESEYLPSLPV